MTREQQREHETLETLFTDLTHSMRYRFPRAGRTQNAPTRKGVYLISNQRGTVVHVGRTPRAREGIAQRLNDHLAGNSSFTETVFGGDGSRLRHRYRYQYLVVLNARIRALLEAYAIGQLCPLHIGTG